jgi:hypothetical protein
LGIERIVGRAEMIGAAPLRHATDAPQAGFDPFAERLEANESAEEAGRSAEDSAHEDCGQHAQP